MHFMRSMRGGFIFRNRGPSLKERYQNTTMKQAALKQDSGGQPWLVGSMTYFIS
jgi:hypothetical protein